MFLQIFTAKPVCSLHINHERWEGMCNSEAEHGVDTDCPADQTHKQPPRLSLEHNERLYRSYIAHPALIAAR